MWLLGLRTTKIRPIPGNRQGWQTDGPKCRDKLSRTLHRWLGRQLLCSEHGGQCSLLGLPINPGAAFFKTYNQDHVLGKQENEIFGKVTLDKIYSATTVHLAQKANLNSRHLKKQRNILKNDRCKGLAREQMPACQGHPVRG